MADRTGVTLADVKRVLDEFARATADIPREQAAGEFGDLLLFLIRLAERHRIDLMTAGELQIVRRAVKEPRAV